jgi:hypothetical protein
MKKRINSWSFRKILTRTFVSLVGTAIALVLYLGTSGFPDWLLLDLLQKVDTGPFALETSKLKLDLAGGLVFADAQIYRKGVIGPPAVRADRIDITVDPFMMMRGKSFIRGIRVENGEVVTGMILGPEKDRDPLSDLNMSYNVLLENCVVDGVSAAVFSADIECKGSFIRVYNMLARLSLDESVGTFRGVVCFDDIKRELTGQLETHFDPHYILSYLQQKEKLSYLVKLINRFDFTSSKPRCSIDFTKLTDEGGAFFLTGKAWLSDCKYRNVDVLRADGSVEIELSKDNAYVRVDPLLVIRQEGNVRGGLTADFRQHSVGFNGISTMNPMAVIKMVGVYEEALMHDWHFEGPSKVETHGIIDYRDINKREMDLSFDGRSAGIGNYVADECSFKMKMTDRNIVLSNFVGRACNGDFAGNLGFVLPDEGATNTSYKVDMNIKNADATKALALLTSNDVSAIEGKLYCNVSIEGILGAGNGVTAKGKGVLGIKDGKIFSLPVFGELSSMMRKAIPGLNFVLSQSDMKVVFSIADGKIHADEIQVNGDILSLLGKGDYYLDRRVEFDVQLKLMKAHTVGGKLIRVITYPISKLFEFRLTGTIDDPKWYPVNFSSDLLERIGIKKKRSSKNKPDVKKEEPEVEPAK